MENRKCDFAKELIDDGFCKRKRRFHCDGDGSCAKLFDNFFGVLEEQDVCAATTEYGNWFLGITDELIEQLKNGKVLARANIFIKRVEDEEEK